MQTVQQELQARVEAALQATVDATDLTQINVDALKVVPCANAQFGDYQFNGALPLAKAVKTNPRALAQQIVEKIDVAGLSAPLEIAGPGFINFRLTPDYIAAKTAETAADARLGVTAADSPRTVVVDYSSPNVAKIMHVGHIRSTIIGDAIARLLRFMGHQVITDNHIGDWGTQFGKVITGWKQHLDEQNLEADPLGEMERLYKLVNAQADADPTVAEAARAETAKLQSGDPENLAIWEKLRALSQTAFDEIYHKLDIHFDEALGESFYNDRLNPLVEELKAKGIAEVSEGAVVVKFDSREQLRERPLLIQKSDGSALYGTTDLATIQYRMERWHPDEVLYVVGAPQALHFQQVFEAARLWGYRDVILKHIAFGTILGEDGKPFRTRSGETVKLHELLEEAERRSLEIVKEKNPDISEIEQQKIGNVLGISAVKYADLSQNRTSDYVFTWDKLLALNGNSAVYLNYAYVRNRKILKNAEAAGYTIAAEPTLTEPAELELAKFILRFNLAIEAALQDYRLNAITDYLFELAQIFAGFYEQCPVLKGEEPQRSSRLLLCRLTADVLAQGLHILGIQTIEQM